MANYDPNQLYGGLRYCAETPGTGYGLTVEQFQGLNQYLYSSGETMSGPGGLTHISKARGGLLPTTTTTPTGGYPAVASTPINVSPTEVTTLDLNQFAVKFNAYSPSGSGQEAHREHQHALNEAWTAYQNTGAVPWGEATITPTTPTGGYPAVPSTPMTAEPCDENGVPCSISGKPVAPPTITPAPPYEISPAQQAFEEMYGGKVTEWVEAGGYGIPEETQAQMIQAQTDVLKAKETEDIRVMRNNMERRGITNSGFVFSNEQAIKSNTSVTLANSIRDVQINSALMKMASFEKAMGAAGQFLGYLSEQSQLKYAPEFATWQAEQLAKMQAWQAQIDIQKMAINQAYQQQNINLQAQLTSQLAEQQHGYDLELAEMEIEANNRAAKAKGAGSIIGTIIGGIFSLINPTG